MDSKKIIADAFRELARSTPIDKISVAAISREAGLSRQVFYSYFIDKFDLSIRIYEVEFAPIAQKHRDGVMTWNESGIEHLNIYARDPDYYRNVLSSFDPAGLRSHLTKRMRDEFKYKCERRGAVFDNEEMDYALRAVVGTINELTYAWINRGCPEPPEELVRRFDLCRPFILAPYLEDTDSTTAQDIARDR
ncbi:TetR/AcrR family transcriptional regulator [Adlercreutzia sp. R25]|uniref:TetR/AcrR family transcriptional regulator n=1 Tax=Adlercreutzia shanghongiae TaxID=3111773 RepID=A0ABU6IVW1_9ACTN|nr:MULTISPECIES: TetR/AcrR family transcriptional regulator [unclassified Adlercreutzia]MEC4272094.1 TetR/AcrR family transcriptional regulator [Adlercreutzia sp. R25]MEC4293825.1 TetR/AcrR family transcriptional regulator [Adlercreutzia sp. R22]